jgi:hypothetical protein
MNIEQIKKDWEAHCKEYGYNFDNYCINYCGASIVNPDCTKLQFKDTHMCISDTYILVEDNTCDILTLHIAPWEDGANRLVLDFYEKLMKEQGDAS